MKFSELDEQTWLENKQYFDTCLLPITGLSGKESPHEVTWQLEALRDIMELIEIPYKGRVVTYPAVQYANDSRLIDQICKNLKKSSFKYVIAITANVHIKCELENADIWITPHEEDKSLPSVQEINRIIDELWNSNK